MLDFFGLEMNIVTSLSAIALILSIINYYFLSKNRIVYPIMISICLCYIILDISLAMRHGEQKALLVFVLLNAYAIAMLTKGWRKKSNEKQQ